MRVIRVLAPNPGVRELDEHARSCGIGQSQARTDEHLGLVGERGAVMRGAHGNRSSRQECDAFRRVTFRNLHSRRQQHAHVEPARRVTDEVQLAGPEAAAREHLPAQCVGAPRNRGRRLRFAKHDASFDPAPPQRRHRPAR